MLCTSFLLFVHVVACVFRVLLSVLLTLLIYEFLRSFVWPGLITNLLTGCLLPTLLRCLVCPTSMWIGLCAGFFLFKEFSNGLANLWREHFRTYLKKMWRGLILWLCVCHFVFRSVLRALCSHPSVFPPRTILFLGRYPILLKILSCAHP